MIKIIYIINIINLAINQKINAQWKDYNFQ
jgi:hypothetical protein